MQQQITRGDYLKDLITIYIENNLQQELNQLYSQFVFQCGEIQKFLTPAQVIKISFTEQESQLLTNYNTCYLAGITTDGHKETFNGSLSFNTRGEVVYYEPTPNGSVSADTTSSDCPCTGLRGFFANCTQPAIKAYFSLNYVPTKLSELANDTDFVDSVDVAESILEHNASESAHPYIQSVMADTTEALTVSIQAETTARIDAVSLAISTTEGYTDSIVSVATEATKAYADSITSAATTATEAYADACVSVHNTATNAHPYIQSVLQSATNDLQTQIDGLAAASDVTDIVGTYAELQAYDTQHLNNNDIIKVLSDETHDDEPSYYRFNKTAGTFSYIGSESAAYTKAQSNSIFVAQTTTVNNKPLSSDITLTYSDVDALSETYATVISGNTSAISANTSAIAANTSVIAQHTSTLASHTSTLAEHTTAIAANTSDISGLKNLSNLTSNGEARLHALKAYADNGELLQDADGLSFVKNYAHSTFDRSKFTVVGSPNITDDGIASGFSSSNYLKTANGIIPTPQKNFKIICEFLTTGIFTGHAGAIYAVRQNGTNTDQYLLNTVLLRNGTLTLDYYGGQTASGTALYTISANQKYKLVEEFTTTTRKISLFDSNNNLLAETPPIAVTGTISLDNLIAFIGVSGSSSNWQPLVNGSIDLKQFSITVDGVEVFSGNKTGVDTVKPDDYTAQGSMAGKITADGIASDFTTSDYITIPKEILNSVGTNSWSIEIEGEWNNSGAFSPIFSGASHIYNDTTAFFNIGHLNNQETWISYITLNDNGTKTATFIGFEQVQKYGQKCVQKVGYDNAEKKYYSQLVFEDGTEYKKEIQSNLYLAQQSDDLVLGYNYGDYKLNLNTLKIYISGVLKYQGCLKIPYTESKTGSKIVDSVYRDRVNDMADQFGYANYYTLNDTDFTLPQVELYGLIEKLSNRPDYDSVITVSDVNGSSKAYTIGAKCLAIIKPSTPASTYTISVQPAYGSAYKSISGYGYMTLEFDTGDKVYASVASSMDVYLIR